MCCAGKHVEFLLPFCRNSEFAGSLEAMIRGLSGTAIAEHEAGMGSGDDGERQGEVKDLEHGVKQGGKVRGEWTLGVLLAI